MSERKAFLKYVDFPKVRDCALVTPLFRKTVEATAMVPSARIHKRTKLRHVHRISRPFPLPETRPRYSNGGATHTSPPDNPKR